MEMERVVAMEMTVKESKATFTMMITMTSPANRKLITSRWIPKTSWIRSESRYCEDRDSRQHLRCNPPILTRMHIPIRLRTPVTHPTTNTPAHLLPPHGPFIPRDARDVTPTSTPTAPPSPPPLPSPPPSARLVPTHPSKATIATCAELEDPFPSEKSTSPTVPWIWRRGAGLWSMKLGERIA